MSAEQGVTSADAAVAVSEPALAQDQIAIFKALDGGWATAPTKARSVRMEEPP